MTCPQIVDDADRHALHRQEQQAHRDRFLAFRRDPDGTLVLTGKLPALAVRDLGCAFPGCDRPPADCETDHRVQPWAAGGRTDLTDGVLLCPHHHHVVEPDPAKPPERNWRIDLDHHGKPCFTAPVNHTGQRITRQHHRYRT